MKLLVNLQQLKQITDHLQNPLIVYEYLDEKKPKVTSCFILHESLSAVRFLPRNDDGNYILEKDFLKKYPHAIKVLGIGG